MQFWSSFPTYWPHVAFTAAAQLDGAGDGGVGLGGDGGDGAGPGDGPGLGEGVGHVVDCRL